MHPVRFYFLHVIWLSRPINCDGMFVFGGRLRAELAASNAREAALREMLGSAPAPGPVPTERDVFGDDEDDSEPMDLAST